MHSNKIPRAIQRILLIAPLVCSSVVSAQTPPRSAQSTPPPAPPPGPRGVYSNSSTSRMELPTPVAETPVPLVGGGGQGIQTLSFITPDTSFDRNLIKDAPFSADATTEHVQTLGDGNRMVRKSTAHIYRDSAGRTRREHELTRGARPTADGEAPRLIVINDFPGQVNYTIETQTGVARKRQLPPPEMIAARARAMGDSTLSVLMPTSAAHRRMAEGDSAPEPAKPQKERLEPQVIEGVQALGTRTTLTIPAGEFDNEQPLVITHEEWYAPDLHMIILMKHNDPRFGVTEFRLTNISRGEQSPELFQLPPGYKVVDGVERGLPPTMRGDAPIMRRPGVIKN